MNDKKFEFTAEEVITSLIIEQTKLDKKIKKVKFWSNFKLGLLAVGLIYYIGYNQGRWEELESSAIDIDVTDEENK